MGGSAPGTIPPFAAVSPHPLTFKFDMLLNRTDDCGHFGPLCLLRFIESQAAGFELILRIVPPKRLYLSSRQAADHARNGRQ